MRKAGRRGGRESLLLIGVGHTCIIFIYHGKIQQDFDCGSAHSANLQSSSGPQSNFHSLDSGQAWS